MKGKIKLYIAVIGLVGICCLVLYQGIGTKQEESYEYSDDYVQVKELPAMLDFYYFTKEEWDSKTREEKDEIKVMLKEKYPISSSQNSGSASVIILNIYKYGYQR